MESSSRISAEPSLETSSIFVEALRGESDRGAGVFDVETGLEGVESDFAAAMRGDRHCRWTGKVEVIAIPDIGLDDPPAPISLQLPGSLTRPSKSLGGRLRLPSGLANDHSSHCSSRPPEDRR
jgi:hypothetical protein